MRVEQADAEPRADARARARRSKESDSRGAFIERALRAAAFDTRLKLTGAPRVVLVLNEHRDRKSQQCNPGVDRIATFALLKRRGAQRAVSACERGGAVQREYKRSRPRANRQGSSQYHLLAGTPLQLVKRVATGSMSVFAAMLGRIVFIDATIEATARDLAGDTGIPPGRIPAYQRKLEATGHIIRLGDGLWTLPGLEQFAEQTSRPQRAQTGRPGVDKDDALACTNTTPEPFDVEPCEAEPFTPLSPEGEDVGGSDDFSKRKGKGKRLGTPERIVEAGGDARVVTALAPMITGLRYGKNIVDPVGFMVQMANDLAEFDSEAIAAAAEAMRSSRYQWPSSVQMREAVTKVADPTIDTLHFSKVETFCPSRWEGGPTKTWKWKLTLNDEAHSQFNRLGPHWRPQSQNWRSDENVRHVAFCFTLPQEPIAGRPLMKLITAWVDSEFPRAESLAAAAAEAVAEEERRAAAAEVERATLARCEDLIDLESDNEADVSSIIAASGLDQAAQDRLSKRVDAHRNQRAQKRRKVWSGRTWRSMQIIAAGMGRIRCGEDVDVILSELNVEMDLVEEAKIDIAAHLRAEFAFHHGDWRARERQRFEARSTP